MDAIRIRYDDNGIERTLVVFDPDSTGVLADAYAAAGAVHLNIGPGAHGCKFEKAEDVVLYPKPKKQE